MYKERLSEMHLCICNAIINLAEPQPCNLYMGSSLKPKCVFRITDGVSNLNIARLTKHSETNS